MKRILVLIGTLTLTACSVNSTDALETHQIIAAPANRWVHWGQESPLNVTQEKIITNQDCPSPPSD